ncbi:hypothetical protein IQ266_18950 [filamentous cyanobacterium LEGE 11480]|uniref:Uncharacterized protein n=1 Tax=Romeriopsis navalis LEGE 11480 TaxID=2777977 RepID=A0A928Z5B1_9CYAN|nr:hypothetical protein [Romeriopsis navalis]MBE9031817.1 hypothetical protein [Romeriopsis navalis LEGE 11480]
MQDLIGKVPRLAWLIIVAVVLSMIVQAIVPKKPKTSAVATNQPPAHVCVLAGGNIHQLVTVYSDDRCTKNAGIISGAGGGKVVVAGEGGQKTFDRSEFARAYYVWSDDKAIPR